MILDRKSFLIFWSFIIIFLFAMVLYVSEYHGYPSIDVNAASSRAGTVVPGTYIITLKNNVSLESFASFLENNGLRATQIPIDEILKAFPTGPLAPIPILRVVIPEDKTIGEVKQIFDPHSVDKSLVGREGMPITNAEEGCKLIRGHPDVEACEPERAGSIAGPAGPGI
jgi:hypothetical protein